MFIDITNKILNDMNNQKFLDEGYKNANLKFSKFFNKLSKELKFELLEVRSLFSEFYKKREEEIIIRTINLTKNF